MSSLKRRVEIKTASSSSELEKICNEILAQNPYAQIEFIPQGDSIVVVARHSEELSVFEREIIELEREEKKVFD